MRLAALLLALSSASCASAAVVDPVPPQHDVRLTVYPRFAFAGNAAWITCYVPDAIGEGVIRYGLEGFRMSGPETLTRIEYRTLIEHLECGMWVASCTVVTAARLVIRREAVLAVAGLWCHDGFELAAPFPQSSLGYVVPFPVGTHSGGL